MTNDLDALAARAAAGDQDALDRLLRAIEPRVLRQCARLLPYREDAEEACQDTLLAVARNIAKFRGRSQFTTWLYAVTANSARQTYRSLKQRSTAWGGPPADVVDPGRTSVVAGSRLDLLEALEYLESRNPDLVAPFVLRDVCDQDYSTIAQHLGIPTGTVKSRIHEARRLVRDRLAVSG